MKTTTKFLVPALFAALVLSACGEKEAVTPAAEPAPVAEVAPAPAPAESSAGGYVPTAEELVPGIMLTQEELDKRSAEALKDTPKPMIPGEAPVAAPAAAPAEVTPAAEVK